MYAGSILHGYKNILPEIESRCVKLSKPHRESLSVLTTCLLSEKTVNLMVLAESLPRKIGSNEHRYQYISRFLKNPKVIVSDVMSPFILELIQKLSVLNQTVILMMDQSKISDGFECLMVSVRLADRAIPVAWKVIKTDGAIGFDVQKKLLDEVVKMLPDNITIMLSGDRFYGTSALINWCQTHDWQYRIRLKGNFIFDHEGGEITGNDAAKMKLKSLENATFNDTNVSTNIGILHEKGHKEPWIIAMDCKPNKYRILDYGMRWGIECMFSDFKSRGFGITKTKLTTGCG